MGKHLVFVYGTLKRGQPNSHLFGSHAKGWFQFEGVGETVDLYRLVIASSMHIPFVLAEKGAGEVGAACRIDKVGGLTISLMKLCMTVAIGMSVAWVLVYI